VVEDDRDVRINTTGMLRELRYNVLDSSMAAGALHLLETHPEIDLLFTDVGLPGGMNGRQLADVAQRIRPDLKVLFTSGYARDAIVHRGRLDPGIQFLAKPFTYAGLASKIAQSLKEGESVTEGKRELRVLLVEDDVLVRMLAQQQLASLGCKVETAASIEQAMEKVKELGGSLDVAVIDIGLPDGKGDKLAAELRALYPRLPIVIASGYDDESMRRLFKGDANIRFIGKPYLLDDLKQAVGK
jgi:CheY-like chemotaxis protein